MRWSETWRRRTVVTILLMLSGVTILALFCYSSTLWYGNLRESRLIAALEAQGAGVETVPQLPDSAFQKATAVLIPRPPDVEVHVFGTPVDLRLAAQLRRLIALDLSDTVIREEDVQAIAGMRQLTSLGIGQTGVPPSLWPELVHLENLDWLLLEGVDVNDEGLTHIGKMRWLDRLVLIDCGVTDRGVAHLRSLTRLRYLDLSGNPITDGSVPIISQMPSVPFVRLNRTRITPSGAATLKSLGFYVGTDQSQLAQ